MIKIDYTRAVELAKIASASKGADYVYTNDKGEKATQYGQTDCYNTHTDEEGNLTPGCLVGTIFHLSGIPLERIQREGSAYHVIRELNRNGSAIVVTTMAEVFLNSVQTHQDKGASWGSSIAEAEAYMEKCTFNESEEITYL